MSAFKLYTEKQLSVLTIEGWELDSAEPIVAFDNDGKRVELGESPLIRVLMYSPEAVELWKLLDDTVGAHWREGEAVRKDFEQAKQQGVDTSLPTREEYEQAKEIVFGPISVDRRIQEVAEAASVMERYERGHDI